MKSKSRQFKLNGIEIQGSGGVFCARPSLEGIGKLAGPAMKKITCGQVKQLPNAKQRVKCMKAGKPADGSPAFPRLTQWIRDLLADGDLEANPGLPPRSKVDVASCVCPDAQKAPGAWQILELMIHDQVHVGAVQEMTFSDKELKAFRHYAFRKGHKLHHQQNECCQGAPSRGAGLLASKTMRSSLLRFSTEADAQAVAVCVNGVNFSLFYFLRGGSGLFWQCERNGEIHTSDAENSKKKAKILRVEV